MNLKVCVSGYMQAALLQFASKSHSFSLFDSLLTVKMQIGITKQVSGFH